MGYLVGREAVHRLMDTQPEKTINELKALALEEDDVVDLYDMRIRYDGPFILVDMKIEVDQYKSVREGHAIASRIKKKIIESRDDVGDVLIHVNPKGERDKKERKS